MASFDEMMISIYGWKVKNNEAIPPRCILPECVRERIRYFARMATFGMSFMGCMEFILTDKDEELNEVKKFDEISPVNWLPVSDEFQKWYETTHINMQQQMVAVALLYNTYEENYVIKIGDKYLDQWFQDGLVDNTTDAGHFSKQGAIDAVKKIQRKYVYTPKIIKVENND